MKTFNMLHLLRFSKADVRMSTAFVVVKIWAIDFIENDAKKNES